MILKILIALLMVVLAIIIDWQKDKTSFLTAAKMNALKYVGVFAGVLLAAYLPWWAVGLAAGACVYFFWTLIVNLFK